MSMKEMSGSNSICFICLRQCVHDEISLDTVVHNDEQNKTEVKYVFPELAILLASEIPPYMCCSCRTTLHNIYKFKKRCLETYERFIRNTNILQGISAAQDQKLYEIETIISNSEQVIKQDMELDIEEGNQDSLLLSEEQEAQKTVVYEETESEDSVNQRGYRQVDADSENEQEEGFSSAAENQLKQEVHIDSQEDALSLCKLPLNTTCNSDLEIKNDLLTNSIYFMSKDSEEPNLTPLDNEIVPNINLNSHKSISSGLTFNDTKSMTLDSHCSDDKIVLSSVETPYYESDKHPDFLPRNEELLLPICESVANRLDDNLPILKTSPASIRSKVETNLNHQNSKRIRGQDFCIFCNTLVFNFARHIFRHHSLEPEIKQVLAMPVRSKERKNSLTLLRNKGNFRMNSENCEKRNLPELSKLLPCEHCLGYYSRKHLWRHRKTCIANYSNKSMSQTQSQSFLVKDLPIDKNLREKVFPHMRADEISLIAKKDPLICAFGARYLKIHVKKHIIQVTSRKMREVAKLLIEIKKIEPLITNLFTALQPKYFEYIVTATKIAAKYDAVHGIFESPTYAMAITTSLKQCCEIAIEYAFKKQDIYANMHFSEAQSELQTMIELLKSRWKFYKSSQPANDLNINKLNKVIVPLSTNEDMDIDFLNVQQCESNIATCDITESTVEPNSTITKLNVCNTTKLALKHTRKAKSKRELVPWTNEQKNIVNNYFQQHIALKKPPKRRECETLIKQHPGVLTNKSWLKIKVYVQNKYTKKLK